MLVFLPLPRLAWHRRFRRSVHQSLHKSPEIAPKAPSWTPSFLGPQLGNQFGPQRQGILSTALAVFGVNRDRCVAGQSVLIIAIP